MASIESKAVNRVNINGEVISGTMKDGKPFKTIAPANDAELLPTLRKAEVDSNHCPENQEESPGI